jgi:hypothetical protein
MNSPAFEQKADSPNRDSQKGNLLPEEELKAQIEQLRDELHNDGITLKRFLVGVAFLTPFLFIILFATWFSWH